MFLRRAFLLLLVAFAAPALAKPPEPPVKRGGLDFLQGLLGLHMDEKPPRAPELKIIGAGLSKTVRVACRLRGWLVCLPVFTFLAATPFCNASSTCAYVHF